MSFSLPDGVSMRNFWLFIHLSYADSQSFTNSHNIHLHTIAQLR